jgi:hypothetical protein
MSNLLTRVFILRVFILHHFNSLIYFVFSLFMCFYYVFRQISGLPVLA